MLSPVGSVPTTCFLKRSPRSHLSFLGFLKKAYTTACPSTITQLPFCIIRDPMNTAFFFLVPENQFLCYCHQNYLVGHLTLIHALATQETTYLHIHLTTFAYLASIVDEGKEASLTVSRICICTTWSCLLQSYILVSIKINVVHSSEVVLDPLLYSLFEQKSRYKQ